MSTTIRPAGQAVYLNTASPWILVAKMLDFIYLQGEANIFAAVNVVCELEARRGACAVTAGLM